MAIDRPMRDVVWTRAAQRCEYCQIHQEDDTVFRFHIEHIIARQHGGESVESNLALACHHCNKHKGPNLTGIDPVTGDVVLLFNPRRDLRAEHLVWQGTLLVGLTPTGRATIRVLAINARDRMELRAAGSHGT